MWVFKVSGLLRNTYNLSYIYVKMNQLYFYNSLTRKKEEFKPINRGKVGMYTCGPTVYWYQHIGNLRTYIFSDILKRVLLYNGLKVNQIINITDVGHLTSDADEGEDKMEKAASKEGKSAQDIAKHYFDAFHEDLKKLNILDPSKWTKATDHIEEQVELIRTLEKKEYTYRTNDGIYFDTSKLGDYGALAGIKKEDIIAGKRVKLGEKKHNTDFALWKFSEEKGKRQQEWNSPWGVGFPGWHIECSAMAIKYLGKTFDIHTGGEDHRQIHHPNEMAQSEAATGKKFVNYWMHGAFLLDKEGKKVSKSTGGLYTLSELEEKGYTPMHYRYLCLQTHYRKPLHFSLESLDAAKNAFERVKRKIINLKKSCNRGANLTEKYESEFIRAVNDDLNMPEALQVFLKSLDDEEFDDKLRTRILDEFDLVLGLGIDEMKEDDAPAEILKMVQDRLEARKNKDWKKSDELRKIINDRGYLIEDNSEGTKVKKKLGR